MFKTQLYLLFFFLFLSPASNAQNNNLTGSSVIQSIQVMNHGGFIIKFDKDKSSECAHEDGTAIFIFPNQNGVTEAGAKSLLSTALIAFTTNTKVDVMYSFSFASSYCWGSALYLSK